MARHRRTEPAAGGVFAGLVQTSTPHPEPDSLEWIARAASAGDSFPPDVHRRIRDGWRAYVEAGGKRSLPECMGITGRPGARSAAGRLRFARRVAAIADAWDALEPECTDLSNWRRAEILSEHIEKFARDFWPRWKGKSCPAGTSYLRLALFRTFAADESLPPMTTAGLWELLKRARELT